MLLFALVLPASGCHASPRAISEIVLVVSSDGPLDELRVRVTGPDGDIGVDEYVPWPTFPEVAVLVRSSAPYGPVHIHLEATHLGVITRDAIVSFIAGERRRFDMVLESACRCVTCDADHTCLGGSCVDPHVSVSALASWAPGTDADLARDGGSARGVDAGGVDAACVPRRDSGP